MTCNKKWLIYLYLHYSSSEDEGGTLRDTSSNYSELKTVEEQEHNDIFDDEEDDKESRKKEIDS